MTLAAGSSAAAADDDDDDGDARVLVFTKTEAAHPSTSAGVQTLRDLDDVDVDVTVSADATRFSDAGLARFDAVVLLNNSGDILDDAQQAAFERYIPGGGGLAAIHAVIGAEPGWQFLTDAFGARSTGVSDATTATVKVADRVHPSSEDLPEYWSRSDRWLNFDKNVRGFQHVLATVDETTYGGGSMGFDHPIAWCGDFRGGRVWYTGRGGTAQSFNSDSLEDHLEGGIEWAAGEAQGDCGATVLSNYRMTVIAENQVRNGPPDINRVGEPIGFDVLPNGDVLQTARGTGILPGQPPPAQNIQNAQLWLHSADGTEHTVLGEFLVYNNSEDGIYGPAIDDNFEKNRWVYLYYSPAVMDPPFPVSTPPGGAPNFGASPDVWDPWEGYFQLSRFKLVDEPTPHLDMDSEQKILKVPVNRGACCHVAGDIAFDSRQQPVAGDRRRHARGRRQLAGLRAVQRPEDERDPDGHDRQRHRRDVHAHVRRPDDRADHVHGRQRGREQRGGRRRARDTAEPRRRRRQRQQREHAQRRLPPARGAGDDRERHRAAGHQPDGRGHHHAAGRALLGPVRRRPPLVAEHQRPARQAAADRVNSDGSYSSPKGNLFDERRDNADQTRPEIYAMGFRNPFRLALDENDVAYVTDYSPDSRVPETFRGPAGVGPHGASPYDFDRRLRAPGKFPEYYDGSFLFGEFTRDFLREVRLDSRGEIFKINTALNCSGVNVPPQPPTVPTPERPFDCDSPMDAKFGRDGNFYLLTYGDGFFNANADAQLVRFSYVK